MSLSSPSWFEKTEKGATDFIFLKSYLFITRRSGKEKGRIPRKGRVSSRLDWNQSQYCQVVPTMCGQPKKK